MFIFRTGSEYGADNVKLKPVESDIGQEFTVVVSISPLFNQTEFTLVVSEASPENPTVLLGGVPIEMYASTVCYRN